MTLATIDQLQFTFTGLKDGHFHVEGGPFPSPIPLGQDVDLAFTAFLVLSRTAKGEQPEIKTWDRYHTATLDDLAETSFDVHPDAYGADYTVGQRKRADWLLEQPAFLEACWALQIEPKAYAFTFVGATLPLEPRHLINLKPTNQ